MFEISSKIRIWIGTFLVTLFAMTATLVDIFLMFPPDLHPQIVPRAATTVLIVAIPIGRLVFGKMYEKHLMSEELRRLVDRDRLTDVATRHFFFQQLDQRADICGVSLMIDIDHFKAVNDGHGHLVGDKVIKMVAHALRTEIRERDLVCRFGGEEFVIFLREANEDEGWRIAERMRTAIANQITSGPNGNVNVTISVGGSIKQKREQIEDAIGRADDCLYRAKQSGRNRTVVDWRGRPQAESASDPVRRGPDADPDQQISAFAGGMGGCGIAFA